MDKTEYALKLARIVLIQGSDVKKAVRDDAISAINVALGEPRQKYINYESENKNENYNEVSHKIIKVKK
jgi:hypothetical protein